MNPQDNLRGRLQNHTHSTDKESDVSDTHELVQNYLRLPLQKWPLCSLVHVPWHRFQRNHSPSQSVQDLPSTSWGYDVPGDRYTSPSKWRQLHLCGATYSFPPGIISRELTLLREEGAGHFTDRKLRLKNVQELSWGHRHSWLQDFALFVTSDVQGSSCKS